MFKWAITMMVCAVAAGIVVTGCGGGGSDGNTAQSEKEVFVKQANAICTAAQKRQVREVEAHEKGLVPSSLTLLRTEANEIDAIHAPNGMEGDVNAMIATIHKVVATIPTDLSRANELLKKAERNADEFGLKHCLAS